MRNYAGVAYGTKSQSSVDNGTSFVCNVVRSSRSFLDVHSVIAALPRPVPRPSHSALMEPKAVSSPDFHFNAWNFSVVQHVCHIGVRTHLRVAIQFW